MTVLYNAIPNGDIDPESPITTGLMTSLRDNPIAMFEGTSGAPRLTASAIASGALTSDLFSTGSIRASAIASGAIENQKVRRATSGSLYSPSAASDSEALSWPTNYIKVKEIYVPFGGTYSVYFEMGFKVNASAYGRIYVNGAAIGTERVQTSGGNYIGYSEDIVLQAGDLVQLYIRNTTGGGNETKAQNFRVREAAPFHFIVNM